MFFCYIIISSVVISLLLTGLLRHYALARNLIDIPNERSSHTIPTPRGGGLAIVVTYLLALGVLALSNELPIDGLWIMFAAVCWIALIGFVDDFGHIAARWRLLAHFLAAGGVLFWLGGLPAISLFGFYIDLGVAGDILVVLTLVWWLNLYNFMDGIDGMAGVEALSVSLGAILLLWTGADSLNAYGISVLLIILAASVLGFLVWNIPPARIFMGDVGSTFLGFTLGMLAIVSIVKGLLSPWVWLILGGVFIVDATVTLLRRVMQKECWYEAHRSHAYQKSVARLISHYEMTKELVSERSRTKAHAVVSLSVLMINTLWLLPLAYVAQSWPLWGAGIVLIAWSPLVLLVLHLRAGLHR